MPHGSLNSRDMRAHSIHQEPSITGSLRRHDVKVPERAMSDSAHDDFDALSVRDEPLMVCITCRRFEQKRENKLIVSLQPIDDVPALTDREELETELIRRLIGSYFGIVREMIADQVPKAVMHLLVNHSKDVVQNRLVSELYKEELFQDLLHEDDGIKQEREKCEKLLTTYKEAASIIGDVL